VFVIFVKLCFYYFGYSVFWFVLGWGFGGFYVLIAVFDYWFWLLVFDLLFVYLDDFGLVRGWYNIVFWVFDCFGYYFVWFFVVWLVGFILVYYVWFLLFRYFEFCFLLVFCFVGLMNFDVFVMVYGVCFSRGELFGWGLGLIVFVLGCLFCFLLF